MFHHSNIKNSFIFTALAVLIFSIFFFSTPSQSFAQNVSEQVAIRTIPEIPGPFENVSISIVSYSIDLDSAKITWTIDGKKELSGEGETKFSIKTGGIGSKRTVTITISDAYVGVIIKTFTLEPADMDIIWEATDSYVPPFYKGKALPSSQSSIKILAIPNTGSKESVTFKGNGYIYNWTRNDENKKESSGFNKNIFSFNNSYLFTNENIEVSARNSQGDTTMRKSFEINLFDPLILFYENHPLKGILYGNTLPNTLDVGNKEVSITAEPYFFSPKNKNSGNIKYEWTVNGKALDTSKSQDKSIVILKPEENTSGKARLSLSLSHLTKILLSAERSMSLNFGQ